MFNDFLIWLPNSPIFHSFVPLYDNFGFAIKISYACVRACALYLTDLFNFFLFIPHRFGGLNDGRLLKYHYLLRQRSKKKYTNKALVKRRDARKWKSSFQRVSEKERGRDERRSNNLNKPRKKGRKKNMEKKTTENNDVSSNWAVTLAICIRARATAYFFSF